MTSSTRAPFGPAPLSPVWIVGFVGESGVIDEARVAPVLENVFRTLDAQAEEQRGRLHCYCRLANHADLLALDCAEHLKLPLHLLLPAPVSCAAQAFSKGEERERVAVRMKAMLQSGGDCSWRVAATSGSDNTAHDTAMEIVEVADVLVVLVSDLERGTGAVCAAAINMAQAMEVPVVRVDPVSLAVHHIGTEIRLERGRMLDELEKQGIATLSRSAGRENAVRDLDHLKTNLSWHAARYAHWFRLCTVLFFLGNVLAAALGVISSTLPHETAFQRSVFTVMVASEVVLIIVPLLFRLGIWRRPRQRRWTDARMGADLCRGMAASLPMLDPLRPAIAVAVGSGGAVHEPSLPPAGSKSEGSSPGDWRRFALSVGLSVPTAGRVADWRTFRDETYARRLREQISYFESKAGLPPALVWFDAAARYLAGFTAAVLVVVAANRTWPFLPDHWRMSRAILPVFCVLLPLLTTLPMSILAALDYDRRRVRYPEVAAILRRYEQQMHHVQTEESFRRLVQQCESLLVAELNEWYLATNRTDPS